MLILANPRVELQNTLLSYDNDAGSQNNGSQNNDMMCASPVGTMTFFTCRNHDLPDHHIQEPCTLCVCMLCILPVILCAQKNTHSDN